MAFVFPEDKADFTAPNGITYTWVGNRWRTKSLNGEEYLPKTNPYVDGQMTVVPTDWMQQSKFRNTSNDGSYFILKPSSTSARSEVEYWGLTTSDHHIATVGYVNTCINNLKASLEGS